MDSQQILAFRLARSGLDERGARTLAEAAACPASDFARDAALQALAARSEGVTREGYDDAVDSGELVLAHVIRSAIHALAPDDHAALGRALISTDDKELTAQLGTKYHRSAKARTFAPTEALAQVADATRAALARGRKLGKDELHEELRQRVDKNLMPWCRSCGSHHVAPALWRYATIQAGARLDSSRSYLLAKPGRASAAEAARMFLSFYAPATPTEFAEWAGINPTQAGRIWERVEADLDEVAAGKQKGWALRADAAALDSPPEAAGVRLLPPGDPYLQKANRALLAPEANLRKRMFRPVASPGAVLKDGRLVGLWRAKRKKGKMEITIEKLGRFARADVEGEAALIAELRGASEPALVWE